MSKKRRKLHSINQWFCVECRENDREGIEPKSRLEAKMDSILKVLSSLHARLDRLEDTQNENLREVERKMEEVVEGKVKEYNGRKGGEGKEEAQHNYM